MARTNSAKIKQFKKPLNINLGMIFFGVIFIYLLVCVFLYFTSKHVAGYQVKTGSLFVNNVYTGLALRDENLIMSDYSGYLNYYVREGGRIGAHKMVCTVDEGGRLKDIMNEQSMGENRLSDESLEEIRDDIMNFSSGFHPYNFSSTYDFKNAIAGTVINLANTNILDNLEKLNRTGDSGLINICKAPTSGIVVYSIDGYENFEARHINSDILSKKDYSITNLISKELVSAFSICFNN